MAKPRGQARREERSDSGAGPPAQGTRKPRLVASNYLYIGELKILSPPEPIKKRKPPRSK